MLFVDLPSGMLSGKEFLTHLKLGINFNSRTCIQNKANTRGSAFLAYALKTVLPNTTTH